MELKQHQQESEELLRTIITMAWENIDFKKDLIENPREAIIKATGVNIKLPEGKILIVEDQTDENTVFLNIPVEPNMGDMELSEDQLEAIAGGSRITLTTKHLHGLPSFLIKDS